MGTLKGTRQLTRQERAAMWLYGREYSESRFGAIEFYENLSEYKKRTVDRMIKEIMSAPESVNDELAAHGH